MKSVRNNLTSGDVIVVLSLILFLSLGMVSCASTRGNKSQFQVIPVGSQDVAELSADDIVIVMRRVGFSDEQIVELGTQLRDGLLLSGAAQISRNDIVEAIFVIRDDKVHITARLRGNFIYDLQKGSWLRFGRRSPQSQPMRQAPAASIPGIHPQSTLPNLRDRQTQSGSIWQR